MIRGAAQSDIGRVRARNEDTFGFFPETAFFVVADGMGGHAGGEIASQLAVETMFSYIAHSQHEDLTPVTDETGRLCIGGRRLSIAIQRANAAILERSRQDPSLMGMGTTVAAILFDNREPFASIGHVGDSRVYRVRNGTIEQLTEDHSLVQQLLREGKIRSHELKTSRHRHILTQAVGVSPFVQPTLRIVEPQPGDLFLLCSDGVHGTVEEEEMLEILTDRARDLQQQCDALVNLANERGGPDNSTVILLRYEGTAGGNNGCEQS
ncbi:MAG: Stp1/IreP family PP2C-type Ser/Thr phosphatase [Candidatus Binatia bacterium]|nr:Stp1/IreP family PP2C-type Ser/Thr phosphatase [Candidatus Binatia bacterium]